MYTVEEKKRNKIHKKLLLIAAALFLILGVWFLVQNHEGQEPEADFFAYTDRDNRLYLWREGNEEPVLLTDCAFAVQEGELGTSYWEAWDYWQEWDEAKGVWIRNEEKALQDVVWETPDQNLLFPENMQWTVFGMQRGAEERREALTYMDENELEEWMKVRTFCYDLYMLDPDAGQQADKLAENVLFYSVDEKGAVWYCQAEADGTMQAGAEELPCVRCILYRYDGRKHQRIGEVNGRRSDPYRVEKGGKLVFFYGMDDRLYGCRPGKEPGLLAEGVDTVLGRDDRSADLFYIRDGSVYEIRNGNAEKEVYAGRKDGQSICALGKDKTMIIVLEAMENSCYSDWITPDISGEEEDARRLWELMEEKESGYYPLLCTVRVMDLSVTPAETVDEIEGYVILSPITDEEENAKDVYYMEMMPADSFEKIPLSELLGDSLPGDVLYLYECYLDNYGENYADQAFAWGLEECWEREAFEKRASVYAVTKTGICPLDGLEEVIPAASKDYSGDGALVYLSQYQSPDMESDYRRYGHHSYYGYLENRYALDGDGNCQKVVELADETLVAGNEVFYSRNMGLEGYVSLYGTGHEEVIASAADISLESLKKSENSDTLLFLAEGLIMEEDEETVSVYARTDLRAEYQQLGLRQEFFLDEKDLHTLVLCREGTVQELKKNIYNCDFYGTDSVWMLQYGEGGTSRTEYEYREEEEKNGRIGSLFICENGKIQKITDQAVWVLKAGRGEGSRSASWVLE